MTNEQERWEMLPDIDNETVKIWLDQLLEDIEAGRKYMKVYRQMKMYNDTDTNPILYGKK